MSDLSEKIFQAAEKHRDEAVALLRRLMAVSGESNAEGERLQLLKAEIERLDAADRSFIDSYGNLCWVVGQGPRALFLVGRADTSGPGPQGAWQAHGVTDPLEGRYDKGGRVRGLGAASPLSGLVSQVFATRILRELGLARSFTIYSVATVGGHLNPGGGTRWIFNEGVRSNLYPRPEAVVLSEATGDTSRGALGIYRGHRGLMEVVMETRGAAAHAATPTAGVNAIMAMAPVLQEIEALQQGGTFINDPFLGAGSVTVTRIRDRSPSDQSVAPWCQILVNRRLTAGESRTTAMAQLLNMPSVRALGERIKVQVRHHDTPTWKGYQTSDDVCHGAWSTPESSPAVTAALSTWRAVLGPRPEGDRYEGVWGDEPRLGAWKLGTDGLGVPADVPTIGLGPGREQHAHTPDDQVDSREMTGATAFLALYPTMFVHQN